MNTLHETLLRRIQALNKPLESIPTGHATRLESLHTIRAVVFDIYGTLLVSGSGDIGPAAADDHEEAFHEASLSAGLAPDWMQGSGAITLREEIVRDHEAGLAQGVDYPEVVITEIWRRVLERLMPTAADTPSEAQIRRLAVEYECRTNPVWPIEGMLQTIKVLNESGLRLGIVSNAQFYTPLMLEALCGQSIENLGFEPGLCVWSYKQRVGKPSGHLFRTVCNNLQERFNIMASQTLYVGNDMLKDIWPASKAGMRTALFAGDARSLRLRSDDKRCNGVKPDLVIDQLEQIPRCLNLI